MLRAFVMIRVAAHHAPRPVKLLEEDDSRQLVRQGLRPQAHRAARAFADGIREAEAASDTEADLRRTFALPLAHALGPGQGRECFAGLVEQVETSARAQARIELVEQ